MLPTQDGRRAMLPIQDSSEVNNIPRTVLRLISLPGTLGGCRIYHPEP